MSDLTTEVDVWRERALKSEGRAEALLEQLEAATQALMAMKRDGYRLPEAMGDPPEAVDLLPDSIIDVVAEFAEPNSPTHRRLMRYASRRLRQGTDLDPVDEATVVGEIRKGGSLEGF